MPPLSNHLIPITISIATIFGVLIHDNRLVNAASFTSATPHSSLNTHDSGQASVSLLHGSQHIHAGSAFNIIYDFNSNQPSTQPRHENDRKYATIKRFRSNNSGSDYCLPFI